MRRAGVVLFVVSLSVLACRTPAPQQTAPRSGPTEAEHPAAPSPVPADCGTRPGDWCPAPAGDPCGAHKDLTSCRADPRCGGRPYSGESVVACKFDGRGFGENCPTVGCVSLGKR
ncbi:MAG TPA: hypothetical protein VKQ32_19200 [Polyangia bacterium]|nr:hypothetical protein [Polyangia bacterium]